jgi:anti-anti-sigma factor
VGATWSVVSLPGDSVRVQLRGEIDLQSERPFVEKVETLADSDGSSTILLDLAAVDFIDSSGVRALVRLLLQHGDRLRLVALSPPVRRVLDIAGLTASFGLEDLDGRVDGEAADGRAAG